MALYLLGFVLCVAFGFLDELYQQLIPGRGFEWIDILANSLGAAGGLLAFAKLRAGEMTGDRRQRTE